jgi:putative FmdB family regulatory protein
MPIYEFVCEKCGSRIEIIQRVGDAPPKRCRKCRGKLQKAISRTSFQLKGSGWYATDYPHKQAAPSKDKPEKSGADKADKADKKAEPAPSSSAASSDGD